MTRDEHREITEPLAELKAEVSRIAELRAGLERFASSIALADELIEFGRRIEQDDRSGRAAKTSRPPRPRPARLHAVGGDTA